MAITQTHVSPVPANVYPCKRLRLQTKKGRGTNNSKPLTSTLTYPAQRNITTGENRFGYSDTPVFHKSSDPFSSSEVLHQEQPLFGEQNTPRVALLGPNNTPKHMGGKIDSLSKQNRQGDQQ